MNNLVSILFILGSVLSKVTLLLLVPTLYVFFTGNAGLVGFVHSLIILSLVALLLCQGRLQPIRLQGRDIFITTTLIWGVVCSFGALPFILIQKMSFTNAFFETMSGLTTTGASVIADLTELTPGILLWRSLLQWMGGIGFIVMAVAILPFLDVGGMRLFYTESSDWSEKSTPRMKNVAKQILSVYLVLTLFCFIGFRLCGMTSFEAINHAFTTLSTGGFSTSNQSMAQFSFAAHWNAILFMILGSLPFLLFVQLLLKKSLRVFYQDQQVMGWIKLLFATGLLMSFWLWYQGVFTLSESLRITFFNVVNIISTTGYSMGQFDQFTSFSTVVFAVLMLLGGCSGSTAGGIKMFRLQICTTMLMTQIKRLIHPSAVFPQVYNGKPVTEEITRSVVAFMVAFLVTTVLIAAILALCGLDPVTACTGAMAAVSNVGLGMGPCIGPSGHFADLPTMAKWALACGMLLGRLEVMTVLVLFFPAFWKS